MAYNTPKELIVLNTQTVSGVASVVFNSFVQSQFNNYKVEIRNLLPVTANQTLNFTMSTDNGATYLAGNYFWAVYYHNSLGGTGVNAGGPAAACTIQDSLSNAGSSGANLDMYFYNLNSNTFSPCYDGAISMIANGSEFNYSNYNGSNSTTTAVNALKFVMASGNLTGTFTIFGSTDS